MGLQLTELEMKAYELGLESVGDAYFLGMTDTLMMMIVAFLILVLLDFDFIWGLVKVGIAVALVCIGVNAFKLGDATESVNKKIEVALENMNETLRVDSKPLKSFEIANRDKVGLIGEIERVSNYISGKEYDNTVVKYTFFNNYGGMDAGTMEYNEDVIDIIETNEVDPKIEKLTYTKQVLDEVIERVEYKFYVPVGTVSNL